MDYRRQIILLLILFLLAPSYASTSSGEVDTTYTIELESGWNLISVPLHGVGKSEIEESCEWGGGPWWWNPRSGENGEWSYHKEMDPQKGYWVKVSSSCAIEISGRPVEFEPMELAEGDNLISSTDGELTKSDIENRCSLIEGPIWWQGNRTEEELGKEYDKIDPLKGYWVTVSSKCIIQPITATDTPTPTTTDTPTPTTTDTPTPTTTDTPPEAGTDPTNSFDSFLNRFIIALLSTEALVAMSTAVVVVLLVVTWNRNTQ